MILEINESRKFIFISTKNNVTYQFTSRCTYMFNETYNGFTYVFEVYEESKESDDSFSLILLKMENETDLKVVDLYPDSSKYYLGKGISISLLLKCREIFGKRIISSSNLKKSDNYCEWNTPEAIDKVWNPLVKSGKAIYDQDEDLYVVI